MYFNSYLLILWGQLSLTHSDPKVEQINQTNQVWNTDELK